MVGSWSRWKRTVKVVIALDSAFIIKEYEGL